MENFNVAIPLDSKLFLSIVGFFIGAVIYLVGTLIRFYISERKSKYDQIYNSIQELRKSIYAEECRHNQCEKECERKRTHCIENFIMKLIGDKDA